jgi:glycerol-3-phosphate acyltransferase PlsY
MWATLVIAAASYFLGSIPFGYLLVRLFRGEDVRKSGSGNIGATNVSRKSPALGVLTLLLDACKGTAVVVLAHSIAGRAAGDGFSQVDTEIAALFAVLGHMFPLWLKFRGGKGVATSLGSFAVIAPGAVLVAACIFGAVVFLSRYVSLGSMIAAGCFPLLAYEMESRETPPIGLALMAFTSLLIIAKHRENIRRLLAGTESRMGAKRT